MRSLVVNHITTPDTTPGLYAAAKSFSYCLKLEKGKEAV